MMIDEQISVEGEHNRGMGAILVKNSNRFIYIITDVTK